MITGILFYFHQTSLLKYLSGSQLAVWYYRAMGAEIGKGVLLNSLARWAAHCGTYVAPWLCCHFTCVVNTQLCMCASRRVLWHAGLFVITVLVPCVYPLFDLGTA
jgi:hypothetical protein